MENHKECRKAQVLMKEVAAWLFSINTDCSNFGMLFIIVGMAVVTRGFVCNSLE